MSINISKSECFESDGICTIKRVVSLADIEQLRREFSLPDQGTPGKRLSSLPDSFISKIRELNSLHSCASGILGPCAKPVRVIAFDKTENANWGVPWHQDRTIAVRARHETDGYGPWSVKDGVIHVEPPVCLLENMVTLRLHLDPCGEENGPLEVIPGSHVLGRLPQKQVLMLSKTTSSRICLAEEGDVLVMKALIIHRSRKAQVARNRRILHIDYCAEDLPEPLEWALNQI